MRWFVFAGELWHTGAASKEVERKNSKSKRESRTPKDSGFFATRFLNSEDSRSLSFGREGDGYNTRKGKKSA